LQTKPNQIHSEPNPSFFKNRTETEPKLKNLFRTSLSVMKKNSGYTYLSEFEAGDTMQKNMKRSLFRKCFPDSYNAT